MANVLADARIPLKIRMALSNAALAYANALVDGDRDDIENAMLDMESAAEDMRLCLQAAELGMAG